MYIENFKHQAKDNTNFRKVLFTAPKTQIVAMSLRQGEDIGMETHPDTDQIFFIIDGSGEVTIAGETQRFEEKTVFVVPAGSEHNVRNTDHEDMKLLTIYAPPQHPEGTIQATKPIE